jgi:trk system potassium uptake protein TrkH
MSGLTTTGATVLTGLDMMPRSILLWRSMLQWLGGIGIVAVALFLLPFLRVGGMRSSAPNRPTAPTRRSREWRK